MNLQQISKSMLEHHVQVAKDRAPSRVIVEVVLLVPAS